MAPQQTGIGYVPEPAAISIAREVQPSHFQALFDVVVSLIRQVNGRLSLAGTGVSGTIAGNHDAQILDVAFPTANAEVTVKHDLGRVPVGYIAIRQDAAGSVYDSNNGSWTEKLLYLKRDIAANVKLLIL